MSSIQKPTAFAKATAVRKSKIQNRTALSLAVLALVAAALAFPGCSRTPAGPWKTDNAFIMSHRSTRVFAPVETAASFAYAVRAGADALDVDLRLTHDNVVVCSHDGLVLTRDVFGPVELLDWADLARANVGFEFDPSAIARAVTFDEFVRWCATNDLRFHFESKDGDALAAQAIATVDRYKAMPLVSEMTGFRRPKRDDYRPVTLGVFTPGRGGDEDLQFLHRAAFRGEGRRLKINIDDCRMLADILDRHGERRPLGAFRFDPPPRTRFADAPDANLGALVDCGDNATALAAVIEVVRRDLRAARPALRKLATDGGSATVRAACLWALGRLKDAEAYDLVTQAAATTPKGRGAIATFAATWALSEYDRPEGVTALRALLMRGAAAGDARASGLSGWHAEYAARALGRMVSAGAVEALGDALAAKPGNEYLTQEIAAALARQGRAGVPALIACLDDDRMVHRREIVWALVRLAPDSLPAVRRAFVSTSDAATRRNCLRVLGLAGDTGVPAPALLTCLGSTDADTRALAAWVAGRCRLRDAAPALRKLAQDEDEIVKAEAMRALLRF